MAELDGPRLEPRSGSARQLVVFLHGYGADGNDLIDIGRAWQDLLPDAAFASPHAPRPCGQAPVGREWFPLTFRNPEERWAGANQAAPILESFLNNELNRRDLLPGALALVGFSQGTMMALHVGLRRAVAPAGIVGYSGMLVMPEKVELDAFAAEIRSRPQSRVPSRLLNKPRGHGRYSEPAARKSPLGPAPVICRGTLRRTMTIQ